MTHVFRIHIHTYTYTLSYTHHSPKENETSKYTLPSTVKPPSLTSTFHRARGAKSTTQTRGDAVSGARLYFLDTGLPEDRRLRLSVSLAVLKSQDR